MKRTNKKGISLIVLVITIIVMIILAATIVITLSNNGIIGKANEAVNLTNMKQVQQIAQVIWAEGYTDDLRGEELEEYVKYELAEQGITESKFNITVTDKGVTVTVNEENEEKSENEVDNNAPIITLEGEISEDSDAPIIVDNELYVLSGTVKDENGISSFTIDGNEIVLDEKGYWSTTITLSKNEVKEVVLIAIDLADNSVTKKCYVQYVQEEEIGFVPGLYETGAIALYETEGEEAIKSMLKKSWDDMIADGWIDSDGIATDKGKIAGELIISNEITEIAAGSYMHCVSLTSVFIPDSVTSIGSSAFEQCTNLKKVIIPDSVTVIADRVFYKCSKLNKVNIPNGVKTIDYATFSGCTSLTSITIPDSVTSIDFSFTSTGLTSIIIPASVTSISNGSFTYCTKLEEIIVSTENTVYHSVDNCIIQTATKKLVAGCKNSIIPADGSVTSIGALAFNGHTGLTNITIPNSVKSIYENAFNSCTGLTNVTIPNSVTYIAKGAFVDCTGLTNATFENTSGWYIASFASATSGRDMDVTDTAANANYLTTYTSSYWFRS